MEHKLGQQRFMFVRAAKIYLPVRYETEKGLLKGCSTHKFEEANVLPECTYTSCEAQDEGDRSHSQHQPHRVKAMQPCHLGQVQQHTL